MLFMCAITSLAAILRLIIQYTLSNEMEHNIASNNEGTTREWHTINVYVVHASPPKKIIKIIQHMVCRQTHIITHERRIRYGPPKQTPPFNDVTILNEIGVIKFYAMW